MARRIGKNPELSRILEGIVPIELETGPRDSHVTMPAMWVKELYGEEAYEELLTYHERRIAEELAELEERTIRFSYVQRQRPHEAPIPDWLIVCNCAVCKVMMRTASQPIPVQVHKNMKSRIMRIVIVAGHIDGRPYCPQCLNHRKTIDANGTNGIG